MKVLRKYGDPRQITCPRCDSLLEATYEDIKTYKVNTDYLGHGDVKEGIKCPVCFHVFGYDFIRGHFEM